MGKYSAFTSPRTCIGRFDEYLLSTSRTRAASFLRQNLHTVSIHGPQPPRSAPWRPRSRPCPGDTATTLNANVSHRTHPPGRLPRPQIPHHGRARPLPPDRRTRQAPRRPDLRADPDSHRRPHLRDPRPARPGRRPRRRHRSHPDLKRRAEHWREVPVAPELLRALELVHSLQSLGPRCAAKPLWPLSRATGHRRIAAVSAGVPLPTIAAALGHASITSTAIYTTAASLEARKFLARMWAQEPNSPGSCA